MLADIITSGTMHSLKSVFQKKKERNVIIDPFSCLVKLSLLRYLDEGTKISIYQNRLNFTSPSYIQGIVRFMYGDNREDLHNILLPIEKCVEWYWNEKNNDIVYMFNNAVLGLKFLKNSYSAYATIRHTIDYYIIILMQKNTVIMAKMGINSIDIDKLTIAIMDNNILDEHKETRQEIKQEKKNGEMKKQTDNKEGKMEKLDKPENKDECIKPIDKISLQMRDIHKFLFELWSQREMGIVINLYKEMESNHKGTERDYIYNNIMQYCEMKENKLYKYIEDNSSIL